MDVSDGEIRDELPEDLDAAGYVGPYTFPDNKRRRIPGLTYLLIGALLLAVWATAGAENGVLVNRGLAITGVALVALYAVRGDGVLVNRGLLITGLALLAVGAYHLVAGFPLQVDQTDALAAAGRRVGFAVGHASAQLGWRGIRSRPTWRILLYSNEPTPRTRGLVMVDGVNAEVVSHYVEDNPEDWTDLQ